MIILILGATGLLGNAMFRMLSKDGNHQVFGTIRDVEMRRFFMPELRDRLVVVDNLEDQKHLTALFDLIQPNVVVNCIALAKTAPQDPVSVLSMFSLLPRRLAELCRARHARLVQISTDCVFCGTRGGYTEEDSPRPNDLYGIAKLLGEINEPGSITLRTSIIGHELIPKNGLLEWFLSQQDECKGYPRAIYSGFPSVVLAKIIRDEILPRPELHGIYHLATSPISKFELLKLIAQRYKRTTRIVPDEGVVVDRSLSADKFTRMIGYVPPAWPVLIDEMYSEKFGLKEC